MKTFCVFSVALASLLFGTLCYGQNVNHWLDHELGINYLFNAMRDFGFEEGDNPQLIRIEVKRIEGNCLKIRLVMKYADGFEVDSPARICR